LSPSKLAPLIGDLVMLRTESGMAELSAINAGRLGH